MREPEQVRPRIDEPLVKLRIAPIRPADAGDGPQRRPPAGHLPGELRLLAEAGQGRDWVSWDHPLHGYIFPEAGPDGIPAVDEVQDRAIDGIIDFLEPVPSRVTLSCLAARRLRPVPVTPGLHRRRGRVHPDPDVTRRPLPRPGTRDQAPMVMRERPRGRA